MQQAITAVIIPLIAGFVLAGCGSSHRGASPSAQHFAGLRAMGAQASQRVENGSAAGDGLVCWQTPLGTPNGNNVTVTVTCYFGPFGTDDNSLAPGQQPYLWPNYLNGAEFGRGGADYVPVPLNEVPGSNGSLWEVTLTRFPTTGTFLITLTRNGNDLGNPSANTYMAGMQNDSSFHAGTQSLQAWYVPGSNRIGIPTTP